MRITYSRHALDSLNVRTIDRAWVERTVRDPETTERDPGHPARLRAYRAVPERDGRVLRVVYEFDGADVVIVTTFLDRARTLRLAR